MASGVAIRLGLGGRGGTPHAPASALGRGAGGKLSQRGMHSVLGTGGHMLGSRLEGTKQRKLFFFSAFQATSTLIGKNDRHPRQPLSSGINSVSVAVSTVCADVTDSREAGKAMTCMRITRRRPAAPVSSELLGFFVCFAVFPEKHATNLATLAEMSLILIKVNATGQSVRQK